MNITRLLTAAYDEALGDYDLLLMPTTPMKATELPPADARARGLCRAGAGDDLQHRAVRHHPSSRQWRCPAAWPTACRSSLMLVGKHFDEPTIYRAAFAFEQAGDWKKM